MLRYYYERLYGNKASSRAMQIQGKDHWGIGHMDQGIGIAQTK